MREASPEQLGAIAFAEKVLELLDEGRYTATYKFAVLLALMDLALERTEASGSPPLTLTTRQIAEKTVEIYWPHTVPFAGQAVPAILRQNSTGQAEIVSAIQRFRSRLAADATAPRWQARLAAPEGFEALVRFVEWKLIQMPLPRVQLMGQAHHEFIYTIHWDLRVSRRDVERYQDGSDSEFDNRVVLKPGVGEYLLQLNGLLRPLLHRRWAALVAQFNRLEESQLEDFLFGADRAATVKIRERLWEMQARRCFYCDARLTTPVAAQVDHFIPWARYPDDGLDNLVAADRRCNVDKSSSLAAPDHVARWARRFVKESDQHGQLQEMAGATRWHRDARRTLGAARGIYMRLPVDARLWLRQREFVRPDEAVIKDALGVRM